MKERSYTRSTRIADLIKQEDELTVEGLSKVRGFIRRELAKRIDFRRVPEIEFDYDHVFEQGMKMENLLRNIKDGH